MQADAQAPSPQLVRCRTIGVSSDRVTDAIRILRRPTAEDSTSEASNSSQKTQFLFPASHGVVLHDLSSNQQQFLEGSVPKRAGSSLDISAIASSSDSRFFAVAEAGHRERPFVSLYTTEGLSLTRRYELNRLLKGRFRALSFTENNTQLAALGDSRFASSPLASDQSRQVLLSLWTCSHTEARSVINVIDNPAQNPVCMAAAADEVVIAVGGENILKVYSMVEGELRPMPLDWSRNSGDLRTQLKARADMHLEQQHFDEENASNPSFSGFATALQWNEDLLFVGTASGHVLLFKGPVFQQVVSFTNSAAVTALHVIDDRCICVGYSDGHVSLIGDRLACTVAVEEDEALKSDTTTQLTIDSVRKWTHLIDIETKEAVLNSFGIEALELFGANESNVDESGSGSESDTSSEYSEESESGHSRVSEGFSCRVDFVSQTVGGLNLAISGITSFTSQTGKTVCVSTRSCQLLQFKTDNHLLETLLEKQDAYLHYQREHAKQVREQNVHRVLEELDAEEVAVDSQLQEQAKQEKPVERPSPELELELNFTVSPTHGAAVLDVGTCCRRPIFATTSRDATVRVWDMRTFSQLLVRREHVSNTTSSSKTVRSDVMPQCLSIHPTGLILAVGYNDRVRLFEIQADSLRQVFESPIVGVDGAFRCSFSNGGAVLAVAAGSLVHLFDVYGRRPWKHAPLLRGHTKQVTDVRWAHLDRSIVTSGSDGVAYEWDPRTGTRIAEVSIRGHKVFSTVRSRDGSFLAVSSDRQLRTVPCAVASFERNDSQSLLPNNGREIQMKASQSLIAIARHPQNMFFTAAENGEIRTWGWPLSSTSMKESRDYSAHAKGAVRQLALSPDDSLLFSVGNDGAIAVHKITFEEESNVLDNTRLQAAGQLPWANEELVRFSYLEGLRRLESELSQSRDEMLMHTDFEARMAELAFQERVKSITTNFEHSLRNEEVLFACVRESKQDLELEHEEKLKLRQEQHLELMLQLEQENQRETLKLVERYQQLETLMKLEHSNWRENAVREQTRHAKELARIRRELQARLEVETDLGVARDELVETHKQLTRDIDEEVRRLKEDEYETRIEAERVATLRLKGENGVMRKKFQVQQSEIDDQAEEIKIVRDKEEELMSVLSKLKDESTALKQEMAKRDRTISLKESQIYTLKKRNQTLEKHKFVLDFKIKELKHQIEPRAIRLSHLNDEKMAVESELGQGRQTHMLLSTTLSELKNHLESLRVTLRTLRLSKRRETYRTKEIEGDLQHSIQFVQNVDMLTQAISQAIRKQRQWDPSRKDEMASDSIAGDSEIFTLDNEHERRLAFAKQQGRERKRQFEKLRARLAAEENAAIAGNMEMIEEVRQLRQAIQSHKTGRSIRSTSSASSRTGSRVRSITSTAVGL